MKAKLIFILLSLSYIVNGQNNDNLTPIKAPSSPSSVIIGSQPNSISRPKSWQAVETSLISNYFNESGNIIIPKDYSIELTPYWFDSKHKIKIDEFLNPKIGQSILQNFSLSISSTKNYILKDTLKTDAIGFGLRTILWQGSKESKDKKFSLLNTITDKNKTANIIFAKAISSISSAKNKGEFIDSLIENIKKDNSILTELDDNSKENWLANYKNFLFDSLTKDTSKIIIEIEELTVKYLKLDTDIKQLTALKTDKTGFRLEFASALALNFPTSSINYSYVPKYGFWFTPSFQSEKWENFEILGVLRLLYNDQDFSKKYLPNEKIYDKNYDYGFRLVYKKEKLSIEAEIIGRYSDLIIERTKDSLGIVTTRSKSNSDIQCMFNFNYLISDAIVLSYNLGKKFDVFSGTNNNLISLVTLNYGIGAPKKSNLITKQP